MLQGDQPHDDDALRAVPLELKAVHVQRFVIPFNRVRGDSTTIDVRVTNKSRQTPDQHLK